MRFPRIGVIMRIRYTAADACQSFTAGWRPRVSAPYQHAGRALLCAVTRTWHRPVPPAERFPAGLLVRLKAPGPGGQRPPPDRFSPPHAVACFRASAAAGEPQPSVLPEGRSHSVGPADGDACKTGTYDAGRCAGTWPHRRWAKNLMIWAFGKGCPTLAHADDMGG